MDQYSASRQDNVSPPAGSPPPALNDQPVASSSSVASPPEPPAPVRPEPVVENKEESPSPVQPAAASGEETGQSPLSKDRPWRANATDSEEEAEPKFDYGTPWRPGQNEVSMIDLPPMEMPKQKVAAVNFDRPVVTKDDQEEGKKKFFSSWPKKIFRLLIILLPFGLLAAAGVMAYQVTYQRATFGFPGLEQKVSGFILELPFTPKTPEYVFGKMMVKMKEVKSMDFNLSAAITSDDFTELLGMDSLQIAVKGDMETLDDGSFRGNFRYDLTKEIQADVRINEEKVYFKINTFLPTMMGLAGDEEVEQMFRQYFERRWFYLDITDLGTEADRLLDEYNEERKAANDFLLELDQELKDRIFAVTSLEETELNGEQAQLVRIQPDEQLVKDLLTWLAKESSTEGTISPDYYTDLGGMETVRLSDMKIEFYIDELSRLKRFSGAMELSFQESSGSQMPLTLPATSKIRATMVFDMDNFDKRVTVEEPPEAQSIVELIEEMTGVDYSGGFTQSSLPPVLGELDLALPEES